MLVRLKIERHGPEAHPSLRVFARALSSVQSLALELGRSRVALDPNFAGRSEADVVRECELYVADLKHSSAEVCLTSSAQAPELFAGFARRSLGPVVEEDLDHFIRAVEAVDEQRLKTILPDQTRRARAIRSFLAGLPDEASDHILRWSTGPRPLHAFLRPSKERLAKLIEFPADGAPHADRAIIEGRCLATLGKDGRPSEVAEWLSSLFLGREAPTPMSLTVCRGETASSS